ncbi:outer membrane protein assembly factor BamE [Gammaproteobacteria bacterium]|nr:outer membrane protein assembly factor BamE [Gammaproteobacteria bacterium]MDC1284537.1 outer membrane protein assembly factor BamE [Gammaproteobacteria bacterium]
MSKTFIYSLLLCLTLLSGCSGKLFTIHKIDVQQGNAVEVEKVEQLAVGMTKEQVEFLLGSPMLTDIFHPERWDYIYYLIPGYGEKERRHVSIIFNGNKIIEIVKSEMAATTEKDQTTLETEADSDS